MYIDNLIDKTKEVKSCQAVMIGANIYVLIEKILQELPLKFTSPPTSNNYDNNTRHIKYIQKQKIFN